MLAKAKRLLNFRILAKKLTLSLPALMYRFFNPSGYLDNGSKQIFPFRQQEIFSSRKLNASQKGHSTDR